MRPRQRLCGPETLTMREPQLVAIVDDDESMREALPDLLREFGYAAEAYSSAEELLASDRIGQIKCLVLDIAMPGMSGLELQQFLADSGNAIPIIFISAHGDETVRKHLKARGAVECLVKPFSDTALLAALRLALTSK
jgi:FixJ family two-component response regulator